MRRDLLKKAAKLNRENRWKRIWHRVTTVLASIVIFCTTYALILPAITMELEEELLIQQVERDENYSSDSLLHNLLLDSQTTPTESTTRPSHTHTDDCYTEQLSTVCGLEESPGHGHSDDCYADVSVLLCGQEESEDHSHGDACYTTQRQLVCEQAEHEPHYHNSACLQTEWILTCGLDETGSSPPPASEPEGTDPPVSAGSGEDPPLPHEEPIKPPGEWVELLGEPPPRQYDFEDDVVAVSVILPEDSAVPPDAVLQVTAITYEDDLYDELAQQANDAVDGTAEEVVLYDVSFLTADDEYLPVAETATVSFRFKEQLITPTDTSEVTVLHYSEETDAPVVLETLKTALDEDEALQEITFQTEGFSVFAVVTVTPATGTSGWVRLTGDALDVYNLDTYGEITIVSDRTANGRFTVLDWTDSGNSADRLGADQISSDADLNNADLTRWVFEKVNSNQYRIFCTVGNTTYWLQSYSNNSNLNVVTDRNDATIYTVTRVTNNSRTNTVSIGANGRYINQWEGNANAGFGCYGVDGTGDHGSALRLYVYESSTRPVTNLNGESYAIVNLQNNTSGYGLLGTPASNANYFGAEAVTTSVVDGTTYVIGEELHAWVFEAVAAANGTYRIKHPDTGQYLIMNGANLTTGAEGTVFTVRSNAAGKVQIIANGNAITRNGTSDFRGSVTSNNKATQWHTLATDVSGRIRYHIDLPRAAVADPPTIFGGTSYTESFFSVVGDDYIVRAPSSATYMVRDSANFWYQMEFAGWMINGDANKLIQPGQVLSKDWFDANALGGNTVELTSLWLGEWNTSQKRFTTNFYVSLDCQVMNQEDRLANTIGSSNFTASVYATSLSFENAGTGADLGRNNPYGYAQNKNDYLIYADDYRDSARVDAALRGMATEGLLHQRGDYIVYADSFPEDEYVFEQLRKLQTEYIAEFNEWLEDNPGGTAAQYRQGHKIIIFNGNIIPVDQLTMENYSIRWYVNKYMNDDSWHLDGVLVSKLGKLTVTKSFFGDQDKIDAVKNNFFIEVIGPHFENGEVVQDGTAYQLNLQPQSPSNPDGYQFYDPVTDTYCWVIEVHKDTDYQVQEQEYIFNQNKMVTSAEYMIENSEAATGKWLQYNSEKVGVHIKAYSYWDEVDPEDYQTLNFRNSYVPEGTIIVWKEDYQSQEPIPNVQFRLTDGADNPVFLYHEDGTDENRYLLYQPDTPHTIIEGGLVTCSEEGYFTLRFPEGTDFTTSDFKLTELSVPEGYAPISDVVTFHLDGEGDLTLTGNPDVAYQPDANSIHITNRSKTTRVEVEKRWAAGDTQLPVTMQLLKDGVPIPGDAYRITLDGTTDSIETVPWTVSWENLPLYSGGKAINYSLRELFIGDAAYNLKGDTVDGFVEYIVTQEVPEYYDSGGNPVSGALYLDQNGTLQTATRVRLVIRNERDKGMLKFLKMNDKGLPLQGARFAIYTDPACNTPFPGGTMESDASGVVYFAGLAAGINSDRVYYMKETQAPPGYAASDTVYKITVSIGKTPVITVYDGDSDNSNDVTVTQILNQPLRAELQLRKTDTDGQNITGAWFQLQVKKDSIYEPYTEGGHADGLYEVSAEGWINFGSIPAGDYRLVEALAPPGYYTYTSDILFRVENGVVTLTAWDPQLVSISDTSPYMITVKNLTGEIMPETGGIGTHWYVQGGALLMALAVLVFGYDLRRKRERRNE